MRKYLLLILSLFIFFNYSYSQTFLLYDESNTLINSGATITINGDTGTILSKFLKIKNNSSSTKTIKLKKIIIDTLAGTSNDFCFGGECHIPEVYLSSSTVDLTTGSIDSSFEASYRPNSNPGTSTISYVFFDIHNILDSVYVNIAFNANIPSNITEILMKQIKFPIVYPNPVKTSANFSWSIPANFHNSRIIIRDLVGAIVNEYEIKDFSGEKTIDLSDLRNGVYFYSLLVNDAVYITRKLIVKH